MTPKQIRFCEEYLIDMNGTQAAIRAGYSKKTANEQAARLLANVSIQDFIKILREKQSERTRITADMVIAELGKIGFANIQDYIKEDNEVTDFSKIDRGIAAAVASVKNEEVVGDTYTVFKTEFKLHDKLSALEKLGRHLGIFEKDNQQKTVEIRLWEYARASDIKKHGTRAAKNDSGK